jgi:hypothetical protein
MPNRVIQQSIVLPATPERLYAMYFDSASHAAFTGEPVTIAEQAGAKFVAFDGKLSGTILAFVKPRLIVQAWRSMMFKPNDPDSILILSFSAAEIDPKNSASDRPNPVGRIDLIHLDVPEHDFLGVTEGWPKFYWEPWKKYLLSKEQ